MLMKNEAVLTAEQSASQLSSVVVQAPKVRNGCVGRGWTTVMTIR